MPKKKKSKRSHRVNIEIPFDNTNCEYRGFILKNGMKVLLITSQYFSKCGAALNIQIGSMNDPHEIQGLAHLLEHVITWKMFKSDESDFAKSLKMEGGIATGLTYTDFTTYYFEKPISPIYPTLKKFAELIFTPVFDEFIIATEVKIGDSEYVINSTTDIYRMDECLYSNWQICRLASKFRTGNKYTLDIRVKEHGINIKDELQQFHELFYSTNIMSLCVYSKESLDTLESSVRHCFSTKPNRNYELLKSLSALSSNYCIKWCIVPTSHIKTLRIYFFLPDNYDEFSSKPAYYISYLLKHRGRGSLLKALKDNWWAISIDSSELHYSAGQAYIALLLVLTQQGLEHVDDVITLIFQYIELLRSSELSEYIYNEYSRKNNILSSLSVSDLQNNFISIAQYMNRYPLSIVLKQAYCYTKFPRDEIKRILKNMQPRFTIFCVTAREYEDQTNDITPWMQTKFKRQEIPKHVMRQWSNIKFNKELILPTENQFHWNFESESSQEIIFEHLTERPKKLRETNSLRVWHSAHLGRRFEMHFQFTCKAAYQNVTGCNLNSIFAYLLEDCITEYIYPAEMVGISCNFVSNIYGISLFLHNYQYTKQFLKQVLVEVISKMSNVDVSENKFEMLKERHITSLKEKMSYSPEDQAMYYLEILLTEPIWPYDELLENVMALTVDRMQQFIQQFFKDMFVECLIYANLTDEEVTSIIEILEIGFRDSTRLWKRRSFVTPLDIPLEKGSHFVFETTNSFHKCSCTMVYYQIGMHSLIFKEICRSALLRLIWVIIQRRCVEKLRFEANLGYEVTCKMIKMNDTCGLVILVAGHMYRTKYVEKQIYNFMQQMMDEIRLMSGDTFKMYKMFSHQSTRERSEIAATFYSTDAYWQEIVSKNHVFSRRVLEEEYLNSSTLDQIRELFQEMINTDSQRKLSIHVESQLFDQAETKESNIKDNENAAVEFDTRIMQGKIKKITDIASFKKKYRSKRQLYNIFPQKSSKQIKSCEIS